MWSNFGDNQRLQFAFHWKLNEKKSPTLHCEMKFSKLYLTNLDNFEIRLMLKASDHCFVIFLALGSPAYGTGHSESRGQGRNPLVGDEQPAETLPAFHFCRGMSLICLETCNPLSTWPSEMELGCFHVN